jgi:hypothetical protein
MPEYQPTDTVKNLIVQKIVQIFCIEFVKYSDILFFIFLNQKYKNNFYR